MHFNEHLRSQNFLNDPVIQGALQQMAPQRHRVLIRGSDERGKRFVVNV